MRYREIVEQLDDKKADEFHRKLDKLVHAYLGHSSDEEKEMSDKEVDEGRHDGNWMKDGVEMCSKQCCGQPVTECTCGPTCPHCDCYEKNRAMSEGADDKRWKQTSMSPDQAIAAYGKENVRVKKGALRNGEDMVEVLVESVMMTEEQFDEAAGEKDACYHKVKSRYKVWPSAYASGALVKCRKVGAANWGNKSK